VPVLSSKNLDELPPCIQQFHIRRMSFCFNIFHVPTKVLVIADTLSRALLEKLTSTDENLQSEVEDYLNTVRETLPAPEKQITNILCHQKADEICR